MTPPSEKDAVCQAIVDKIMEHFWRKAEPVFTRAYQDHIIYGIPFDELKKRIDKDLEKILTEVEGKS